MRGTIELRAAWPGWSATNTLLLPIDPRAWPPPSGPMLFEGRRFAPKHELHVTVVGKILGAQLQEAITDGRIAQAALRQAITAQRWRLRRSDWRQHLRKDLVVESIIEPVALPAMARLHAWLGNALGRSLPVPPPHVTLYVRGDATGIGVPDDQTLARLRVGARWRA